MLTSDEIRKVIYRMMPPGRWLSPGEICELVESNVTLDREDMETVPPTQREPKWRRNVRNVLKADKSTGRIAWDDKSHRYRLPG